MELVSKFLDSFTTKWVERQPKGAQITAKLPIMIPMNLTWSLTDQKQ